MEVCANLFVDHLEIELWPLYTLHLDTMVEEIASAVIAEGNHLDAILYSLAASHV